MDKVCYTCTTSLSIKLDKLSPSIMYDVIVHIGIGYQASDKDTANICPILAYRPVGYNILVYLEVVEGSSLNAIYPAIHHQAIINFYAIYPDGHFIRGGIISTGIVAGT